MFPVSSVYHLRVCPAGTVEVTKVAISKLPVAGHSVLVCTVGVAGLGTTVRVAGAEVMVASPQKLLL